MRRQGSIRARLTTLFTACAAALMAVSCGAMVLFAQVSAIRAEDRALQAVAARLDAEWSSGDDQGNVTGVLREEGPELRASGLSAAVYDARGVLREAIPAPGPDRHPIPPFLPPGAQFSAAGRWRALSLPVGNVTIVLAEPWADMEGGRLRRMAEALGALGLIVVLATALGAWILVGRTLRPIALLSDQAHRSAAAPPPLRPRLSAPSQDREITHLVETLNALLVRGADADAARSRFYTSASHELRTPLQALSGHLELVLSRPSRTESEYRAALEEALAQARRLTALSRDLLWLNRLGGAVEGDAAQPPACEPVDLGELCARTAADFRQLADERSLELRLDIAPRLVVSVPVTHIAIVIRNLLENAVRYATRGGGVTVEAHRTPAQGAELRVTNTFDAADALPLDRLGEPFFRPDASRSGVTGGNGLGLALCRAVAALDGWELTMAQDADGICVTVAMPSAS